MSNSSSPRLLRWPRILAHVSAWVVLVVVVDYRDSYLPRWLVVPDQVAVVGRYMDGAVLLVIAMDALILAGRKWVVLDIAVPVALVVLVNFRESLLRPVVADEAYRVLMADAFILLALGAAIVWILYRLVDRSGLVQIRLRYFLAAMAGAAVLVVINFRRGALLEPLISDEASRHLLANVALLIAVMGVLGGVGLAGGRARRILLHALAWLIVLGLVVNFDPLLARWGVDPAWRSTLNGFTGTFVLAGVAGYLTYWVGAALDALPAALARRRAEQATPTK